MRILKIVNSNDGGGVFNCEKQFIRILQEKNVEVDLIISGQGKNLEEYKKMVDCFWVIPEFQGYKSKGALGKLKDIYKSFSYARINKNVVLEDNCSKGYDAVIFRRQYFNFLAFHIGKKINCLSYWHMAGVVKSEFLKNVYVFMMGGLNVNILANSKYTQSTIGSYCKDVIYPGFDKTRVASKNTERTFREKFNIKEDCIVYGVASRIYPGKALDLVVKGFVNSNFTDRYLLIAGKVVDNEYWESIKPFLENKNIIYIGEINNIKNFYASIDILINGGKEAEAFGISIAEALGSAKPILAYKLGGPIEMIEEGVNGWLIDKPTLEEYELAFKRTNVSKMDLNSMGENSLLKSEQFTAEKNVEKLVKLIQCNNVTK